MRFRHGWLSVVVLGLSAGTLGAGPASAASGPSLREEERYWTADRMVDAVPAEAAPHAVPYTLDGKTAVRTPPAGTPDPEHFAGHPTVGTFFFDSRPLGGRSTFCTGGVVHTAAKDIVLTAGHCALGMVKATHRIFVPKYVSGKPATAQPYGVFPVTRLYIDPRYEANTKKPVSDLDLAFAQAGPDGRGRKMEDVTGALTFTPSTGYTRKVTVLGYPSADSVNPQHAPIRCPVVTTRLAGFAQLSMACTGFYGGVSGGPWIENYDPAHGTGKVIGITGGYNGGGNDTDDHWVSYAPLFGKDAKALFDDAAAHRAVSPRPPYQPPTSTPQPLVFTRATWKHAVGMTAGYYTGGSRHMDLIVRWDDGEVTLYQGGNDPAHPFVAESRLAASKSIWTKAVSMTTVNTGGTTDGLAVRWTDGEMTLYPGVDTKGFHDERQLAPPGTALWRDNARLMTGGRFTPDGNRDDLLVTFKDGHVSLFTALTANGLRKQTPITPTNTVWPHAGQLTTGSFTGGPTDDVLVRWSDGETTLYPALTAGSLPPETQLRPANSPWKDAAVVTAGAFTADTSADDVLVRWSDGRLSLFTDVDGNGLHTETPLTAK
ncbi:trypsin-like serine protease [Streptomyces roseirectus]|uniref:Trypsin-like serine protease n=1 Tax=Streptomyces roseirectus TaxID=2768066 RepID=A0A7H0IPV0_9ACTN|nr:trypsin-like serine protease [Streptomyces roseirectus]QNP74816.1 trypsin-like serine protease [Streptomyces roseirectus]